MAVFRVERNKGYTVMSNHHLRNKELMLVEALGNLGVQVLNAVLNILDVLPDMPQAVVSALGNFFDLVFDNCSLIGFFVPLPLVKILLPLVVLVVNFEHIYAGVMWILRKIPVLGIE